MSLFNDFLSLIYPRHCAACSTVLIELEEYLCVTCLTGLPKGRHDFTMGKALYEVLGGRVPVRHAGYLYAFEKSGKIQNLIHAIKYNGQKELAVYLGGLLAQDLQKDLPDFDLVMPIPLHQKKLKKRGYNQSEYFGKGIARASGKPLYNRQLIRTVNTATQTKKRKYERWENVEGIFRVQEADLLRQKHVLLVDDVVTTGATIEAAWEALKPIEGIQLSVASIAFAKKT